MPFTLAQSGSTITKPAYPAALTNKTKQVISELGAHLAGQRSIDYEHWRKLDKC